MEEYLNKIKKNLKEENYETLEELLKLELNKQGKLKRLNNLNKEEIEFMLKLITHDQKLYKDLEKLKNLKNLKQKKEDLNELKKNIEETKNEIKKEVESLRQSTKVKTKIPVLKQIKEKRQESKNKEIIDYKLKRIIDIIEQSKLKQENKNLKQKYFETESMKETLDTLYKRCELKNITEIEKVEAKLDDKYIKILRTIDKDIEKSSEEYKEQIKKINNYDKRLVEYTFNKPNNYVTLSIEHLSKNNIKLNKNDIEIDKKLEHELLIYALIALYKINNKEAKITIIEPVKEETIQKTKKK